MPRYIFHCNDCDETETFEFPISDHSKFSAKVSCSCGGEVVQLLESPKLGFMRTAFPKNAIHEHIADNPVRLRDKKHFADVCSENGWTSHFYDGI